MLNKQLVRNQPSQISTIIIMIVVIQYMWTYDYCWFNIQRGLFRRSQKTNVDTGNRFEVPLPTIQELGKN